MIKQNFDRQWTFKPTGPAESWGMKKESSIVDLPHDFSIIQTRDPKSLTGSGGGFFRGGAANYIKTLFAPEDWKNKVVMLEFEGVYMNSKVRINSNLVAHQPYGYTSFHCDLTPYLKYGDDNKITVSVNNTALPNSRWYSGSGIYRHVWLMIGEKIHFPPWGVYITTPEVSEKSSTVVARTTIKNVSENPSSVKLRSTLLTDSSSVASEDEIIIVIPPNSSYEAVQTLKVKNACLWSVDNPYLYTLKSDIIVDDEVIDSTENKIGIRSITFDSVNGFKLNGETVKLKGSCVHHDCGLLGAASYDRAEERKVQLLKENGFNAVRCAHNPPSPAFLDACDRLGMLVIDEAFDCWREPKNINDYSLYFEDWWQRDLASMVMRDRNHPSIIMWSTGNEIPERNGRSDGYAYARKLADFIRSLDNTRAVTNGLNGISSNPEVNGIDANLLENSEDYDIWGELSYKFVEPLDVVGYNYMHDRYENDGKKFPGRVIYGAESFAMEAYENWELVQKLPYVIGDFLWTGLDYLGEAGLGHVFYNGEKGYFGKYPWHQAYCGDIDICGFKRPQSYYRDCVWGLSKAPYIAVYKPKYYGKNADVARWGWPDVIASWTWPGFEGKPVIIDIYSTDEEIELILNGVSLGRKIVGENKKYIATFETEYQPGELVAVGYNNGVRASSTVLKTAGAPANIRLIPDRSVIKAEFGDLSYITVEVIDKEGNVVHNADNNIYFTLYGVGTLLAVGNGNPVSEEMYVGNQRRVHEGRAMVVVRSNGEPGEITLNASADGMPSASVVVRAE